MSFGDHLEELRACVLRALIGIVVGTAVCIYFGSDILEFLTTPYAAAMLRRGYTPELINLDPTETFRQYFRTAIIFGIGLSAPFALYQLWKFVAAGLYPHERRWVRVFAPASLGLFVLGVLFLVKVVLPGVLVFLILTNEWVPNPSLDLGPHYTTSQPAASPIRLPIVRAPPQQPADGDAWISESDGAINWVIGGRTLRVHGQEAQNERLVRPQYSFQMYLSFVNGMCLAFGLGFQIPIVVVVLVLLRIISTQRIARYRRHVIVAIVVAAAVLTPSGDLMGQMLLAIPMYMLFEIGLIIGRYVERSRPPRAAT